MSKDDHGACIHCGFDLNGERIYDVFLEKYGDSRKAADTAAMYGATEHFGRFGKEIYFKETYGDRAGIFVCPECGKACHDASKEERIIEFWERENTG